jgi:hypothetical protein
VDEPELVEQAPIFVNFEGERAAEGPLTFGQRGILHFLSWEPDALFGVVIQPLDVPAGTRVADLVESLSALLARHEGLRTTHAGDARGTQRVAANGTLRVQNYAQRANGASRIDRTELSALLVHRLRSEYRAIEAPPLRVAVVTRGDVVDMLVVACSHFVVDLYGMHVVKRELAEMLATPALRQRATRPHQPLDQAEAESTPLAECRHEASLLYLKLHLARMPQCLYPAPRSNSAPESLAVAMHSGAAVAASLRIAARTKMSRSTIVLAAVCKVLSERVGIKRLMFPLLTANRFDKALRDYVGTLTQDSLATLDVDEVSFDQLVRRAWMSVVLAGKNGAHDVFRLEKSWNAIASDRGINLDWGPLFNNMMVEAAESHPTATAPLGTLTSGGKQQTELRWRSMPPTPPLVRFDLIPVDWPGVERGWALSLWSGNTQYLPAADMEALLLAVERLLVAAASNDLSHEAMRASARITPIERGTGWLFTDSCWIDMTEVERLLTDALAPSVARLVREEDEELVAYVLADESTSTPEQAHARCMAALPGRKTAMAPRRYVLWESAPNDPSQASGWHGRIASGTGRASLESTTEFRAEGDR